MPRFHLDRYGLGHASDVEGSDFRDLSAARAVAIAVARSAIADQQQLNAAILPNDLIEITDERGHALATIHFAELMKILP